MDKRQARREAEREAKRRLSDRTRLVGDLAEASQKHSAAREDIEAAKQQGEEIMQRARQEAARVRQAAENNARETGEEYRQVFETAVSGGWSRDELAALGYEPPARRRRPQQRGRSRERTGADTHGPDGAASGPVSPEDAADSGGTVTNLPTDRHRDATAPNASAGSSASEEQTHE